MSSSIRHRRTGVLLLACTLPVLAASGAVAAPRLVVETEQIDLGPVAKGEFPTARFVLQNAGDEPLRLLDVRTGCHCTVASYDDEIPPGASGTLEAVVDTAQLTGEAGRGITVYTNDPRRPKIFLVINATVIQSVGVLPAPGLSLTNRANRDDVRSVLLRQVPLEPEPLTVSDIATSVPWLSARARRLAEPLPAAGARPAGLPGDWLLEVDLNDEPPAYGRGTALVSVRTGLRIQPVLELPVDVDLAPPVTLSHESVAVPIDGEATVLVAVRSDLDASRLTIASRPATLRIDRDPAAARRFRIVLSWAGEPGAGAVVFDVAGERYRLPVSAAP